ncbi:MAG: NDP-sugar synthase, partial [bacterium]|nr:NDP-sugar synthase [bacterium]
DLLLVVNGDIFLEIPFQPMMEELLKDHADGILLVKENNSTEGHRYRALVTRGNRFLGLDKQENKTGDGAENKYMYTGVALLTKRVIKEIRHVNFFNTLAANDFNIKVHEHPGIWLDIGDPHAYVKADAAYREYRGNDDPDSNSISPGVTISGDSVVTRSIIWEHTGIKNRSVITDCIVTGNLCLDNVAFENQIITPDLL